MHPIASPEALAAVEAALRAAAADGLWPGGARILVAASGGPDSTALLHALATLGPGLGVASVVAAHVDHGLRPDSAADADAVAALADRLGVGFRLARVEVEGPGGVQAAARRARYRALERLRQEVGADRVATGHTATDQAETVLLRLGRGTTPAGLAGIRRRHGQVIRPLLACRREVLAAWCAAHDLPVRHDPSNDRDAFRRVRVRQRLLPALAGELNPSAVEALGRLASLAAEEAALLDDLAAEVRRRATGRGPGLEGGLSAAVLAAAPAPLARRILARAWREAAAGPVDPVEGAHLDALLELARGAGEGAQATLPGGVVAERSLGWLFFGRGPWPVLAEREVPGPGRYPLPGRGVLEVTPGGAGHLVLPVPAAPYRLLLRGPAPGDRLAGGPKVARLLQAARVPRPSRGAVPLLVARGPEGDSVLWILGVRIAVPPPVTAPSWTLRYLEDAPVAPAEARRDNGG